MKGEPANILIEQASEAVEQCFSEVPYCKLRLSQSKEQDDPPYLDLEGKLSIRNKKFTLLIKANNSGQPRYARDALNALARSCSSSKNVYGIFIAPFISEETAKILAAENVGYIDLSGNCRIEIDGVYIRREGKENRFNKKRDLRSLYSRKGERLLRVMITGPKQRWKVQALAEQAQVSLGQVANITKLLSAREWLDRDKDGFFLTQPEKLLTEWTAAYRFNQHHIVEFYSLDPIAEIEKQIAQVRGGKGFGALTSFSAAARYAPALRYQRVTAYVNWPAADIAAKLGWKSVTSGGNVTLVEPYDAGVFFASQQIEGLQIVSPVQTYLDLYAAPGRGEEGAEALLREVIRPSW